MESATYNLVMRTPLGAKKGTVLFEAKENGIVYATVNALDKTERVEGTYDGESFSFSGTATTPLGTTDYQVTGVADGATLSALCKTRKGDFKVTGKREK